MRQSRGYRSCLRAGVVAGAAVAAVLFGVAGPAAAAPAAGTTMVVDGTDPLAPNLVLTNTGTAPCQVARTALGTLGITQVTQSGTASSPIPTDPSFPDGLDVYLRDQFSTLAPGASVTIPIPVLPVGPTGHALETVTWSDQASLGAVYPVEQGTAVEITATYAVPVQPRSGPPLCAVAAHGSISTAAASSGSGLPIPLLIGAAVLLLALIALVVVLVVRRRGRRTPPPGPGLPGYAGPGVPPPGHPGAADRTIPLPGPAAQPPRGPGIPPAAGAVLVLVAAIGAVALLARPAFATISVDPSLSGAYSQCGPLFGGAGGDPAGLFPILNNPNNHVQIIPANGDQTHEIQVGGTIIIFWNTSDHHAYTGGGNAEPCSALYHEMYHGKEDLTGGQDHSECVTAAGPSGLPVNEVNATKAENVLRVKEGLPARTTYGDTPLPSGPCLPKDQQPKPKQNCTGAGCGDTNGDPHVTTFDGLRYDFQGAGEFIAARDTTNPDFQIQVREQPIAGSQTVAVNSAIAMAVAGDKVEVDSNVGVFGLIVNGKPAPVAATTLPHGGSIAVDATQLHPTLDVRWPDGSLAVVATIGPWGLHLTAQPATVHAGKVVGLLGNFDGNKANDVATASGHVLPDPPGFGDLYPAYADSWRITDATSLFTYPPGENTATYTDRSFPHAQAPANGLPNQAAAQAVCVRLGITDPVTLADCVLDVGETGQVAFALAALDTQNLIGPRATPSGGPTPSAPPTGPTTSQSLGTSTEATLTVTNPNGTDQLTFHALAGQRLYLAVLSSTGVPSGCGSYAVLNPTGGVIDIGCVDPTGKGDVGGDPLADTGTYAVRFTPPNGQTGSMHVRITLSQDAHGTITPDGPPTVSTISVPGQEGFYTFTGSAGERVYIEATGSTMPSGCGLISLRDPENGTLDLGCTDPSGNGFIDGNLLKENGQYAVLVNPPDATVGQISLRVITSMDVHGTTSVGGPPVTATIATAGQVAFFSFAGTKGEKIKVTVTASTLQPQCGIPVLQTPDGVGFNEGCVDSKGTGTFTETLNDSGNWSIKVDPPQEQTGSITFVVQPG